MLQNKITLISNTLTILNIIDAPRPLLYLDVVRCLWQHAESYNTGNGNSLNGIRKLLKKCQMTTEADNLQTAL